MRSIYNSMRKHHKLLMRGILWVFCLSVLSGTGYGQQKEVDTIKLFYLGGQSNMDGYGSNSELPKSLDITYKDVWIFHGNQVGDNEKNGGLGIWAQLQPGHGAGFASDGKKNIYSDGFGVELSFAKRLTELYPGEKIAIIKYSRGGTSIDSLGSYAGCWEPDYQGINGLNQYDNFLATVRNATAIEDIDGDGKRDHLVPQGIIWMLGERDAAVDEEVALRYSINLKRLMDLIRATFRADDLAVVIGKISDSGKKDDGKVWEYGELVQHAQEMFVKADGNAAIVRDTRYYGYSDPWHYDSEGYIGLGKAFADAVNGLIK
jgi:hypothetical protein